jgi:hypothetical protein
MVGRGQNATLSAAKPKDINANESARGFLLLPVGGAGGKCCMVSKLSSFINSGTNKEVLLVPSLHGFEESSA